ncbi:hypothetical protein [Streptomyces avermitilis]|uniref:hypothetical protein n=1 Tax=Streptomyces avermitilis TaxID=33903 RepID=UPI0033A285F0
MIDFAAVIGAGEKATQALLEGRARILAGPPGLPASYSCAMFDWVEERRQRDEVARSLFVGPELDWYDQQLRDEEKAEHRRRVAWVDPPPMPSLTSCSRGGRRPVHMVICAPSWPRMSHAPASLRTLAAGPWRTTMRTRLYRLAAAGAAGGRTAAGSGYRRGPSGSSRAICRGGDPEVAVLVHQAPPLYHR